MRLFHFPCKKNSLYICCELRIIQYFYLDVVLGEQSGRAQLAEVADADVTLKAVEKQQK
jgi:hypothetical protein